MSTNEPITPSRLGARIESLDRRVSILLTRLQARNIELCDQLTLAETRLDAIEGALKRQAICIEALSEFENEKPNL